MSLIKFYWILPNARVTAFIVSELLRENQQEGGGGGGGGAVKLLCTTQIRVNKRSRARYWVKLFVCQRSTWNKVLVVYQWEKKLGIEKLKNRKAFIDYSQTIDGVYENSEYDNPTMKRKVLIVPDDIIANMKANKRDRKLIILLVFILQS